MGSLKSKAACVLRVTESPNNPYIDDHITYPKPHSNHGTVTYLKPC